MLLNTSKHISNKLLHDFYIFQIQIEFHSTLYICTRCLHIINEDKPLLYQMSYKIIPLVQKSTQLK